MSQNTLDFLNKIPNWKEALTPVDYSAISNETERNAKLNTHQDIIVEFYENLFNVIGRTDIKVENNDADLKTLASFLKTHFRESLEIVSLSSYLNEKDFNDKSTKINDLLNQNESSKNEVQNLLKVVFSENDSNIITLNQEEVNKYLTDNDSKANWSSVLKIVAEFIDLYYKIISENISKEGRKDLILTAQYVMKYKDLDESKPRKSVAYGTLGDIGAGKGRFYKELGIIPLSSGTDGISGGGALHEQYKKLLEGFDIPRNLGNGYVPHMEIIFLAAILGYRNYADKAWGEELGIFFDGYPRSSDQAEIFVSEFFDNDDVKIVDGKFMDLQRKVLERVVGYRLIEQIIENNVRGDIFSEFLVNDKPVDVEMAVSIAREIVEEMDLKDPEKFKLQENKDASAMKLVDMLIERGIALNPNGRAFRYRKTYDALVPELRAKGFEVKEIDAGSVTPIEFLKGMIDALEIWDLLPEDISKSIKTKI